VHLAGRTRAKLDIGDAAGASQLVQRGSLGYGTSCAAVESLSRRLAVELGPSGVRVVCLSSHVLADGPALGSSTGELFGRRAAAARVDVTSGWSAGPRT
jgi:NAD(P)-dependent dehydrogenase (short-subunit alcohol dehydrogenase family)